MIPTITLSNGIRVANFSSPHSFNFVDGSVLPACTPEEASVGTLKQTETVSPFPGLPGVEAVVPAFELTPAIMERLQQLHNDAGVDVVIVPFPVIGCLRETEQLDRFSKVATIRMADRVTKASHIDKFCR